MFTSKAKQIFSVGCAAVMLTGVLSACGSNSTSSSQNQKGGGGNGSNGVLNLSIMLPSFNTTNPTDNSPVVKKIDKLTNTKIHLRWVPNDSYPDKFNVTLASGNLPDIMVVENKNSAGFIKAAEAGQFWELSPYLKNYSNLSQLNSVIKQNASINGKLYGIPRLRILGRNGITYRKDWLKNVGMKPPKTIHQFYEMLKAFKNDDPNKDGKNDTYGMVISKYQGPWDIMQTWFGVPNQWGKNKNGKLIPYFMSPHYLTALKFFRKLYKQGLINQDFAAMPPSKWSDPVLNNKAGVIVDVADRAHRLEYKYAQQVYGQNVSTEQAAKKNKWIGVMGAPKGPYGRRALPTNGFNGEIVIPKSTVKTKAELKKVLAFLNKMNNKNLQVLAGNGIKGKSYTMKNGVYTPTQNKKIAVWNQGLNQMLMFLPKDKTLKPYQTPLRKKEQAVQTANKKIVVANAAAGLVSQTYAQKGAQLQKIIQDARIKFISGQINESGLKQAVSLWRRTGGTQVIKEMNQLYKKEHHQ